MQEGGGGWGCEEAGRLITGFCSSSGEATQTWAREVPRFQKNGVESIGTWC